MHNNFFGLNIKHLRNSENLTQTDFGKLLGVSRQQIRNIENNISDPPFKHVVRASQIFSISIDDLVFKDLANENKKPINQIQSSTNITTSSKNPDETLFKLLVKERDRMSKTIQEQERTIGELMNMVNNVMDDNVEILETVKDKAEPKR